MLNKEKLQQILTGSVNNTSIFGVVVNLHSPNETFLGSAGNLKTTTPYFIASSTKLYITAVFLKLHHEQKLDLEECIHRYLPTEIMDKLHVLKGTDNSMNIRIKHLMSQTSGLPDYFEDRVGNERLIDAITKGNDKHWSFEEAVAISKKIEPLFEPGQKNKAHYSDTNYQLLGKILETYFGEPLQTILENELLIPLGLSNTYIYADPNDKTPAALYFKKDPLQIPKAMSSFKADGGIVSTAEETMVFLKAFFNGTFFPSTLLHSCYTWKRVMFPLEYGVGIMRFKLPWFFSPFKRIPEFIGHSGLSGAFMFYVPEKEIYLTGTVNQIHDPGNSFRVMIKLINAIES